MGSFEGADISNFSEVDDLELSQLNDEFSDIAVPNFDMDLEDIPTQPLLLKKWDEINL